MKNRLLYILLLLGLCGQEVSAAGIDGPARREIGRTLTRIVAREVSGGYVRIEGVDASRKRVRIYTSVGLSYYPFREENLRAMRDSVRLLLPPEFRKAAIELYSDKREVGELIPMACRTGAEYRKLLRKKKIVPFTNRSERPLVTRSSAPVVPSQGLAGRHIALWQSHGRYFDQPQNRWKWQRSQLWQTCEDLYTQSYVLPYLVPMLENAGACVMLPRERDVQKYEILADNDAAGQYREEEGPEKWQPGGMGFAHVQQVYTTGQNPFRDGTTRRVRSVTGGAESRAVWTADIPERGEYAVYVSYDSTPQNADDAQYTVHHLGGDSSFAVNQTMGGGTWIYLGRFLLDAGSQEVVTLTNRSRQAGRIVSADAVKIGGGYGNIARTVCDSLRRPGMVCHLETSGYPRFCEAARYWLQWAGIPDSVYSDSQGKNDYTDDYKCRGIWVNYLAGGSTVNPTEQGLNIPVDMAFAFHSDAGTTLNDSIIGTLGIYYTNVYNEEYANGASRYLAHDMTDLIQSNIVRDIRSLYEPDWTRRGMWNQSYYEARVPRVPTMLLELLSHQNFADMRYGLDPRFRFTVSRAIYKGMLQFICSQYHMDYIVQPLPVDNMALKMVGENEIELTWQPVADPLEPTANAEKYIVYTRIGDGDFDNGVLVDKNTYRTALPAGMVCSYKVTAVNKGGESFPSEILSAGRAFNSYKRLAMSDKQTNANHSDIVLIVNGFDRISAPADFVAPVPGDTLLAGFLDDLDHGVPYLKDISYIGKMKEYRRSIPWMDDDASGFGDSYSNYEDKVIAGNTFDYPAIHGAAILKAGYSFISCSDESVENKTMNLNDYKYVDLILGKECQTKMGRGGVKPLEFKTFSQPMQEAITAYCGQGGNIFVSGAYVGTDLWDNRLAPAQESDKKFATEVLKYKWRVGQAATEGKVKCVASPFPALSGNYTYHNELNADSYVVESPDAIEPATKDAYTVMRYSENNLSAGVVYKGAYKTCILGFPFEALRTASEREALMNAILTFFNEKTDSLKQ